MIRMRSSARCSVRLIWSWSVAGSALRLALEAELAHVAVSSAGAGGGGGRRGWRAAAAPGRRVGGTQPSTGPGSALGGATVGYRRGDRHGVGDGRRQRGRRDRRLERPRRSSARRSRNGTSVRGRDGRVGGRHLGRLRLLGALAVLQLAEVGGVAEHVRRLAHLPHRLVDRRLELLLEAVRHLLAARRRTRPACASPRAASRARGPPARAAG